MMDSGGSFFAVKEVAIIEQNKQSLEAVAQLKQEVEFLKTFRHENIVQYLGTDQCPDKVYIFLEFLELGSLEAVYKNHELTDTQISKYSRDIVRGLEYLHARKILHRDIKCANILVDKMGTCKLADFGMAKQLSTLHPTKSSMGSPLWMAPEVINPQRGYDLPADIWSLGCAVLEMATRARPFGDMDWIRALFMVGRGNTPPIPKTLSKPLRDFLQHCFEIDPTRRPTATELLHHPFICHAYGLTVNCDWPFRSRSPENWRPIMEECCSDFSSPQSSEGGTDVGVGSIVTPDQFHRIFPRRNQLYTYHSFITATATFRSFGMTGDLSVRKREVGGFFAHVARKTSGLLYLHESESANGNFWQWSTEYPRETGKRYYGRGPLHISWNYNYGLAGQAVGKDLLNNPDLVDEDPVAAFQTALWIWMTPERPKPSCHDVMTGSWRPSNADILAGRFPGFGLTIHILKPPLCSNPNVMAADRLNLYDNICSILGVSPGSNLDFSSMDPY